MGRCGGAGFRGATSSIHGLVRGTVVSSNLPHFCTYLHNRVWASVMVSLFGSLQRPRFPHLDLLPGTRVSDYVFAWTAFITYRENRRRVKDTSPVLFLLFSYPAPPVSKIGFLVDFTIELLYKAHLVGWFRLIRLLLLLSP